MEDQEQENKMDVISVDVPLFIRLLEFAREDATDDMKLHSVTEKLTEMCQDGDIMTMEQYDDIVSDKVNGADTSGMNEVEDNMHPKNKDMNTINEQRWMKLAGIITENEVNEASEAAAWLVYEKDNHPLVLRFASADRAEAKKIEMEERDDNAIFGSLVFTSLASLGSYLEKEYNIPAKNVEKYR